MITSGETIRVSEETWRKPRDRKRGDERDVIAREIEDDDPLAGFGAMADVEGFREAVAETREELDDDLRERASS